MSELTPEASRLYRVRKTTVKMLHNRGYIVSENELVMTPEAFQVQVCVYSWMLSFSVVHWSIFDRASLFLTVWRQPDP